jgi:hypothetical protein
MKSRKQIIIIIIINILGWAIWPVPSPELKLLSPSFLWSPNCSLSLWAVKVKTNHYNKYYIPTFLAHRLLILLTRSTLAEKENNL